MKEKNTYTSLDQLPLALCAEDVAQALNISRGNAYNLLRMIVPRDRFFEWMDRQISA